MKEEITLENILALPHEQHAQTLRSNNFTSRYILYTNSYTSLSGDHKNFHSSTFCYNKVLEATQMTVDIRYK